MQDEPESEEVLKKQNKTKFKRKQLTLVGVYQRDTRTNRKSSKWPKLEQFE